MGVHFVDDRHALYTGWVTGQLAMSGVRVMPTVDLEGDYTATIEVHLPNATSIFLIVPLPPADWSFGPPKERIDMNDETKPEGETPEAEAPLEDDAPHPDHTLPGDLTDEDIAGEEEEIEAPDDQPALDVDAIVADAQERVRRMKENGRSDEDIANTYAGEVMGLQEESDKAMSTALLALAQRRTADKWVKHGPYNRRRLAVQVASGTFNLDAEAAQ